MHLERLKLTGFRCFGPEGSTILMEPDATIFVGGNGTGKTAAMVALQRMFGITGEQRRLRKRDFHVPAEDFDQPTERKLEIEAVFRFPELATTSDGADAPAVAEFFHQMAADENGIVKCRLLLKATWFDDGTSEGQVEEKYCAVRTFGAFSDEDCVELRSIERGRIQFIYVPATRDAASQVSAFLKGRLWRAIHWSSDVQKKVSEAADSLRDVFAEEAAVKSIEKTLRARWKELNEAGTDSFPKFRPIDARMQEFVSQIEVTFEPHGLYRERDITELSDGQRSLFHLALTAAALDVESRAAKEPPEPGFVAGGLRMPALTLIGLEEPENTLAPFYLSRILRQLLSLVQRSTAQAVVSSHSPSILSRVQPESVRHFRLDENRVARVNAVRLPLEIEDASKYIREAVRSYPELYFAKLVVLGEGATEEAVLPRIARALNIELDPSFVAIVPLGGRHVNHLWRLLNELGIPHLTLLDLDRGRHGGGWARIAFAAGQLIANARSPKDLFAAVPDDDPQGVICLQSLTSHGPEHENLLSDWLATLERYGVYFSYPLDLDFAMLQAYPSAYKVSEPGAHGPRVTSNPREAVLGPGGRHDYYGGEHDELLQWYRYLFLGRGKPSTHVRVLSSMTDAQIKAAVPPSIDRLLAAVSLKIAK